MSKPNSEHLRQAVRETYGAIAQGKKQSCCGGGPSSGSCCGTSSADETSEALGYSQEDLSSVPQGANLGLGCGNPHTMASLRSGETVLDLGSGGGFDCFLAAQKVGPKGRVIGVDMTPDMISLARQNAVKADVSNVEFRLGEIEHLPLADQSVDVMISNCVINLSPEKKQVYQEAWRVLRKGGRVAISDMVAAIPIPDSFQKDLAQYTGCLSGASTLDEIRDDLEAIGFKDVRIQWRDGEVHTSPEEIRGDNLENWVRPALIEARKP